MIFYHASAEALSAGIGTLDSNAVCLYGDVESLDDSCPLPCQALLSSVWGACYAVHPEYKPKTFFSNGISVPMTVRSMYEFLAKPSRDAPYATCRLWLQENYEYWSRRERS
jgi:hypothetical protein